MLSNHDGRFRPRQLRRQYQCPIGHSAHRHRDLGLFQANHAPQPEYGFEVGAQLLKQAAAPMDMESVFGGSFGDWKNSRFGISDQDRIKYVPVQVIENA